MNAGVLALQGDFREHVALLRSIGVSANEVRTPSELDAVDALVIPGGESTTIGKLAQRYGLIEPIRARCLDGMPVLGTCAGMIFLAASTVSGHQPQLGVLDAVVERNAFGRQIDSFEADLDVVGLDSPMHAVFIRAPWIHKVGADVSVLGSVTDPEGVKHPVLVRQGRILASSFHPELTGDPRLHQMLVDFLDAG
ncbi:Pyridoxal 5'-phosphate synthase (glutamine hydrolyzing), glutaminase subunit [hydrothermal vent metagenome]|uniref:glutaminase n=1 Tax=hydrothermal vent metagenome TaxID=652676 RepID=A0A3B0TH66_9ZZZZ